MAYSDINFTMQQGRLTKDAEFKSSQNKRSMLLFSIAVNKYRKGEDGQQVKKTSYFNYRLFGPLAEALRNHLVKGKRVTVISEAEQNEYEKDGVKYRNYVWTASEVRLEDGPGKKDAESDEVAPAEDEAIPAEIPEALPVGTDADVRF